jgi:predicted dehydrogenase
MSDDYPEWGPDEVNNKVRDFLEDPEWARNARGGLCGREVGRTVVDSWYRRNPGAGTGEPCRVYTDFRELLDKEADIDALYIMTPEHLHATIAIHGMRHGKHVITHKPLGNILHEARTARDLAAETGLATHLFCAAGNESTSTICEWVWSGAIGPVREVHNWSMRPVWPQGMIERPAGKVPIPEGFQWDLWLGPVPDRPYHPEYTHAVFRGWYDFGTGALGDMGHYSFHQIFKVLKLGSPTSVEASRSQYWAIEDYTWKKKINTVSYPRASVIHWEFPARGDMPPVSLHWYDGGIRPQLLEELEKDGKPMPEEGMLFVGDRGKILADFTGGNPRLIPEARMKGFEPPAEYLTRPKPELDQFLEACHGGDASSASFQNAYPFAETILLGTIALRVDQKLYWDAGRAQFSNSAPANALIRRPEYRPGWEL